MTNMILDYDGGLVLHLPPEQTSSFLLSGFYKLSLKRYTGQVDGGTIRFKPALNYLD